MESISRKTRWEEEDEGINQVVLGKRPGGGGRGARSAWEIWEVVRAGAHRKESAEQVATPVRGGRYARGHEPSVWGVVLWGICER